MHVPDGIIPLDQVIVYWIIVIIILGIFSYKFSKDENKEKRIVIASIMTVATTIISYIAIPLPFGVSIHFFVIPIVAILLGPLTGTIVAAVALFIQVLIGMGGFTSLGANILVMGVCISIATYYSYKIFNYLNNKIAIVFSTIIGILVGTAVQIVVLILTGTITLETLLASLLPFYLAIAIVEGFMNLIIINTIGKLRPELLNINKL
ncbi:MAG: energy-coupling factor ABC transporter permease [Methanobacteriaceae archaeon]|nr:energy-coupling factor ABC transporter permease [Methanobacteriaceae archaeon]